MKSAIYFSRICLSYLDIKPQVDQIVRYSREWNASVGITGALACSELHFVQFVEGPVDAIDDLIVQLRADRRHAGMNILEEIHAERRHFAGWSLAYAGPDTFIDRKLPVLAQARYGAERHKIAVALRSLLAKMSEQV